MLAPLAAVALLCLLAADAPPAPPAVARLLPRSSIAAVIARRGELGLGDAQVKQLEEREAALQRQLAEIRTSFAAPPKVERGDREGPEGKAGPASRSGGGPGSPGEGRGGGGRHGNRGGGGARPAPGESPAARATELRQRLDDADTAAWLGAEQLLPEGLREPARAVAERYREALADQREAERRGK